MNTLFPLTPLVFLKANNTPRVNSNVNYRLWVMIMSHSTFIN